MSSRSAGWRGRPAVDREVGGAAGVPGGRLAIAHFGVDLLFGATVTLLPASNAADDFGPSTIPVLLALEVAATSLPQPLFGRLADRSGPRRMIVAGMAVGSAAMAGVVLAPSVGLVVALVVIAGLASAAFHPAAIGELSGDPAAGGRRVGLFSALGTLGFAFGPVCAALLIHHSGPSALVLLLLPVTVALSAVVAGLGLGAALQTLVVSSLALDRSGARAAGLVGGLAMGAASLGLLFAGVVADTASTSFLAAIFALVPAGGLLARVPRLPARVDAGIVAPAPCGS